MNHPPRHRPVDLEAEFDRTSSRYDLMVGFNRGYHEQLRAAAGLIADSVPRDRPVTVLDLGCGTGASTAALVDRLDAEADATVLGVDASAGMLERARSKRWPSPVRFEQLRAEQAAGLPRVDGVFACYLFRNVPEPDRVLADVYGRLRPGGCLVVHDYARRAGLRSLLVWTVMCWLVVIPLSLVLTGRTSLYRYLWRSVLDFDSADRFERRLVGAGFAPVSFTTVEGWASGILHTFLAYRPIETVPEGGG